MCLLFRVDTPLCCRSLFVLEFNLFANKPWFLRPCSTTLSVLKTLWEKEKLLVTSNFTFSAVFSTRLRNFMLFSSNSKLSSANSFNLEKTKICRLGKGKLFSKRQYIRLVQIQGISRVQNICGPNDEIGP